MGREVKKRQNKRRKPSDKGGGVSEFADKVRSIGTSWHKGKTKDVPVRNEHDGTIGGKHVEHWDGSQDAVIQPQTVKRSMRPQEGASP